MTDMNEHAPQLRFPEFSGNWASVTLGSIATFSKGKGISKSDIDINGTTPCIRYGELYTTYETVIDEPVSRTSIPPKDLVFSLGGEVIVPASGETAEDIATAAVVMRGGVALGGDLNIIRSNLNGMFLAPYLSGKKRMALAAMAQGNSVVHLYSSQMKSLSLGIPSRAEQDKIAYFLSAFDRSIFLLAEQISELEEYKKGCMERIFNREIIFNSDTGSTFAAWENVFLIDIAEIVGGGTPDSRVSAYWGGDIQWFTPTEIKSKYLLASSRTITEAGLKNSSAKILPKGALLLSSRATIGDVGIAQRECCTNQGFQSLVVNSENCNEFWYYWIAMNKREFIKRASGSTFLEIGKTEISKIAALRPSLSEQKMIANFLSAIDRKISDTQEKLEYARNFKETLLQKMFV